MAEKKTCCVDTRQSNPEMVEPFVRMGWQRATLKAGDYQWQDAVGNLVLLEDKPVSKLVDDIQASVLVKQCMRLAQATPFAILLIRGAWTRDAGDNIVGTRSKMSWQAVWDHLEAIQRLGPGRISIQLATSTRHAVQRIFDLQEKYACETFSSVTTKMPGNHYLQILCKIPGVGIEKAKSIEALYPSLGALCREDVASLKLADGIGPVLAKSIVKFCHEAVKRG